MRYWGLALSVTLCVACGKKLGPGVTPKETIRNFEAAIKRLDMGAAYDMLSSRTRAEIDAVMNNFKTQLDAIPDSMLEQIGLDGLKNMTPREIMVTAVDRAKDEAPEVLEIVKTIQLVVLEVKAYGDTATVKVSTIFQGRDETSTVPLVKEGGRWFIDSDESINAMPLNITPNVDPEACFTPT